MSQELTTELQGESYLPKENTFIRKTFPRISFTSQDKTEGKGKSMTVVEEAGTFFIEKPTDETNEQGKKIWSHDEIGKSFEGVIFFTRKKLSYYDQAAGKFISSSMYDQDTDEIVLWQDGKQLAKGTKAELQAPYMFTKEDGKKSCKLAENKILYVYYNGEVYEFTIKGTSMFEYSAYYKQWNGEPNKNLTLISSVEAENGATRWNKTTYTRVRQLTQEEWDITRGLAREMIEGIAEEKAYFASMNTDVPTLTAAVEEDWSPDLPKVKVVLGDGHEM
jgi:hypothetical protein